MKYFKFSDFDKISFVSLIYFKDDFMGFLEECNLLC